MTNTPRFLRCLAFLGLLCNFMEAKGQTTSSVHVMCLSLAIYGRMMVYTWQRSKHELLSKL
ncbi:unnamed protein product [Albugo candida]|uniref:Uncharacterized protein n=1 Tax=Albugo candida TaxID=65357 RepID=A0A024GQ90_9STRA|nr:unnamed protein product [Albugo candida]|eukprot:CCI49059.1 unnamed protein product [Albugo candida]